MKVGKNCWGAGAGARAWPEATKSAGQALGGGAARSASNRQNGQCSRVCAESGASDDAAASAEKSVSPARSGDGASAIQRGPVLVHTSTQAAVSPRLQFSAWETVGANAANKANNKASHNAHGRCG